MSGFTQRVQYVRHNKKLNKITRSFKFYWNDDCRGEYIEVPVGAITDFATIPWFLRWLWKPDLDDIRVPSVVHDCMIGQYNTLVPIMEDAQAVRYPTWEESARWFKRALKVRKCGKFKRNVFYGAVLLWGYFR